MEAETGRFGVGRANSDAAGVILRNPMHAERQHEDGKNALQEAPHR